MNRKALLLAIPIAIAVPVAAFTQLSDRKPIGGTATGKSSERRLTSVTQQSLAQAIDEASGYMRSNPAASFTIRLPAGRFDLSRGAPEGLASINLSNIDACPGTLTIDGAGMDQTTLVTDPKLLGIMGRGTRCLTISDVGFAQNRIEVSQGTVVSADARQVTIDIPTGFPTPPQLMPTNVERRADGTEVVRRYLRKYVMTPTGAQIVVGQPQIRWTSGERLSGAANRWILTLIGKANGPLFRRGDLLGIKAKSDGQSYRFVNGERITFDHVRWANEARGVFRGVNNVTVQNCVVGRPAPINGVPFLLSTSGGGPQIGQPNDDMTSGHVIQNNDFTGLGDDGLMFARATGIVRNNRITDSFARGIIVVGSPNATIEGNTLTRAPLMNVASLPHGAEAAAARRARRADNDNY